MKHFADQLAAAVKRTGNAVCVGLDPRAKNLPAELLASNDNSPAALADACTRFCNGVIDVVAPLVPIVKPQAAFFEELGPLGTWALSRVIDHAHSQPARNRRRQTRTTSAATRRSIRPTACLGADSPWRGDCPNREPLPRRRQPRRRSPTSAATATPVCSSWSKPSTPVADSFQDARSSQAILNRPLYRPCRRTRRSVYRCRRPRRLRLLRLRRCGGRGHPNNSSNCGRTMPHAWYRCARLRQPRRHRQRRRPGFRLARARAA